MTSKAHFCFHARLAGLAKGGSENEYRFADSPAIKDPIEALGVPHTEVDLIVVAGRSVAFDYQLRDSDAIEVFPFGSSAQVKDPQHLSPPLPERPAFILDVHLGKLARRLRMLGFDCLYRNDCTDAQIIEPALAEGLIILTRDRGILKHSCIAQGYLVGSEKVEMQVREVLERYRLHDQIQPLRRCPVCNGLLTVVGKEAIRHRLQPKTELYYQSFQVCRDCEQLYWQGSHYEKINLWMQELLKEEGAGVSKRQN